MRVFVICLLSVVTLAMVSIAQAQTDYDRERVIDLLSETYGVSDLKSAQTIRLEEETRIFYPSHNYSPDFNEVSPGRRYYVFDMKGERASVEYLSAIGHNHYHGREVYTPDYVRFIDYGNDTYREQEFGEFLQTFGGTFRSSDTMLAYFTDTFRETATYDGVHLWLGRPHHRLTFEYPASPPLILHIDTRTGFISRMHRALPDGRVVNYVFTHHTQRSGVGFAREFQIFVGEEMLHYVVDREIQLNSRRDKALFSIEDDIVSEPERVNQDDMSVERIDSRTHHVGQGEAYSVFIETDDGLLVIGAHAGLSERLAAYYENTASTSKVRHLAITDHHEEDRAGLSDFLVENDGQVMKIYLTPQTASFIEVALQGDGSTTPEIVPATSILEISDIELHSLETNHAEKALIAYSPGQWLYQSGHYISPYKDKPFQMTQTGMSLYDAVSEKGLSLDILLSSASQKPEDWSDFTDLASDYEWITCHRNRPICENWF